MSILKQLLYRKRNRCTWTAKRYEVAWIQNSFLNQDSLRQAFHWLLTLKLHKEVRQFMIII